MFHVRSLVDPLILWMEALQEFLRVIFGASVYVDGVLDNHLFWTHDIFNV